jgi:hypothetical protein
VGRPAGRAMPSRGSPLGKRSPKCVSGTSWLRLGSRQKTIVSLPMNTHSHHRCPILPSWSMKVPVGGRALVADSDVGPSHPARSAAGTQVWPIRPPYDGFDEANWLLAFTACSRRHGTWPSHRYSGQIGGHRSSLFLVTRRVADRRSETGSHRIEHLAARRENSKCREGTAVDHSLSVHKYLEFAVSSVNLVDVDA